MKCSQTHIRIKASPPKQTAGLQWQTEKCGECSRLFCDVRFRGSDPGYKPSTFSSSCHKSSPVAIYGSVSPFFSVCTPAGSVNGSVETDCRQAFAVDHWSRPIRETPSWVAGSWERPVKGAHCIINNEADCKEVSAEAGLSQTLVFNNWPLVMQQRRYTDLVTVVCVLESLKWRVNFVAVRFVWWCKALLLFQHNSLFHVNLFLWGLVLSLLQMVNFSV